MAYTKLGSKAVGSIVKMNVNGTLRNFIVVHQGKPSSIYDESCNGTWLLMVDVYENRKWNSYDVNDYANSTIHSYLNSTFLGLFDANIQAAIKQVKIPYRAGSGYSTTVTSGSSGLSTKIFLLSVCEVGFDISGERYCSVDGAKLDYFVSGNDSNAQQKRIANLNGSAAHWWLRSPYCDSNYGPTSVWRVRPSGDCNINECSNSWGVRPALVLPSNPNLLVYDDGSVIVNTPPAFSCDTPSGSDLGTKASGFSIPYTVGDADNDAVTVTEAVDGTVKRTYAATLGASNSFQVTGELFMTLLNGKHTLTVTANDGTVTATHTLTFTKEVTSATISLEAPMDADGQITLCVLSVLGSIPDDAVFKAEVTNNAYDAAPVWEDCTAEVKAGANHVFKNQTATNGFAFNFRVSVERGESGTGGYIVSVQGGFQ